METNQSTQIEISHPRTLNWLGTTALAIGGSNQSLFLLAALFVGQGSILGQGSAAVPLLMLGLLLSYMAAPGWTELVTMFPNRVGGIAATCAEAFKPYSPVLANLTGVCYWWGWVPTCGLTALLSASAIHQWYLPEVSVTFLACALVLAFTVVNLAGVKWVARLIMPVALTSATLAFLSGLLPILSGQVDWHQATNFHLTTPFDGWFGQLTSIMAGLYLVGFAAPAFEAATCHVGETVDPSKQVPKAMLASALMAAVYFVILPLVWLGTLGPEAMGRDLAQELGPTFAPLFGSAAKAAAIWFMMFNMFHGTIQPLAGASRTLSQLSEDGLLPKMLAWRNRFDTPWVATVLTASMSIFFLLIGDPIWLIAAANFTYLIGICLPSVAVWLLRRDQPTLARPYRAPRGWIMIGLIAAAGWGMSAVLGFQQFGLPTVIFGLVFAYSGAALYAIRKFQDRREQGLTGITGSLHIKLTGAMVAVLLLDGAGYFLAVSHLGHGQSPFIVALEDIFVAVAILTIAVGMILPGMIAHSAVEVSKAAKRLTDGTVKDFSRAMLALGQGKIESAQARVDLVPVYVNSNDELGEMATSFNALQVEIANAARGLGDARESMQQSQKIISSTNATLLQSEQALRISERQFRTLVANVPGAAYQCELDENWTMRYLGGAIQKLTGYPASDFIGNAVRSYASLIVYKDADYEDRKSIISNSSGHLWEIEYQIRCANGEIRWVYEKGQGILDENGDIESLTGFIYDVTEKKEHQNQLERIAHYDTLTNLPNRMLLADRLEQAMLHCKREQKSLAVGFLDLDGFKAVNDKYGHEIGDDLLVNLTHRMKTVLREVDTLARIGGDEFVVVLGDLENTSDCEPVLARLLQVISNPIIINDIELQVSASIGVTLYPQDDGDADQLLRHADQAMYIAKQAGKNRYHLFDIAHDEAAKTHRESIEGIRDALSKDEFVLYYQPKVNMRSGAVIGAEALIRWQHPERGLVPPIMFLPIIENHQLSVDVGNWVIKTALRQISDWQKIGLNIPVSVNVSARQLLQDDFGATLAEHLAAHPDVNPNMLELEILETSALGDITQVSELMRACNALGVYFALDDFGTGYSSLTYLKRLPANTLKIDQSFIRDMTDNADDLAIVQGIVALARAFGREVIAEGVETIAHGTLLLQLGCEMGQGYGIARPMPAGDFPNWAKTWHPDASWVSIHKRSLKSVAMS